MIDLAIMASMKSVTISEAKNNLSRHIQYVRRGGRVRIYARDEPVADLVPIAPSDAGDDDELRAALVRRGVIRPAREGGRTPPELLRPGPRVAGGLDALLADREERDDAVLGRVRRRPPRR